MNYGNKLRFFKTTVFLLSLAVAILSVRLVYDLVATLGDAVWAMSTAHSIVGENEDNPHLAADALSKAMLARVHVGYSKRVRSRFLRASARETWDDCAAHCGEGSRLLIVLLRSLGIPANRVNLTHDNPHIGHVAVIYQVDGEWFLMPSIGERPDIYAWMAPKRPVASVYSVRFSRRDGGYVFTSNSPFFDRMSYYDFSRLTGGLVQVVLMVPPPQFLVALLEYPERICLTLDGALLLFFLLLLWQVHRRLDPRKGRAEASAPC